MNKTGEIGTRDLLRSLPIEFRWYRSGTVNSKSFVGKVFLQIIGEFELNNTM